MAVHVGVMQMMLEVPGARSSKDRRRALKSLKDRVLHRFDITWNEIQDTEGEHDRRRVVCTSATTEPRVLRSTFDKVRAFVEQSGRAWPMSVDVDVFPWHPAEARWESNHE